MRPPSIGRLIRATPLLLAEISLLGFGTLGICREGVPTLVPLDIECFESVDASESVEPDREIADLFNILRTFAGNETLIISPLSGNFSQ